MSTNLPQDETSRSAASALITGNTIIVPPTQRFQIEFTGSGSEYFRIWIVNLMLMLLTFGLYYPWAKVRKLRYFHGNTVVAGHALDFHGNPRKMLRGFLLISALLMVYSMAGNVSDTAGTVAFVIMMAVWPALFRASLQFRLANTSWRGLRFAFNGSLKESYKVFFTPVLAFAALGVLSAVLIPALLLSLGAAGPLIGGALMLIGAVTLLPYCYWQLKTYQHSHYAYAQLQTEFRATARDVMGVFNRTGGMAVMALLGALAVGGLVFGVGLWGAPDSLTPHKPMGALLKALLPALVLFILLSQAITGPYFVSRMQNLVWSRTGNQWMRFKSDLSFSRLLMLTLKNWALVVCTLGLYWPFAAIALTRLKLQAVSVHMRIGPDELVAQARGSHQDAAGDAAADLLGIDVGL
ncbi:MAG: YjgN family protein [Pseudomonadota bacterium]